MMPSMDVESSILMLMASPKSQNSSSCRKLLILSLFLLSLSFIVIVLSLKPKAMYKYNTSMIVNATQHYGWFDLIASKIESQRVIKIGLVNTQKLNMDGLHGSVEAVPVRFEPVSKDLKWEDVFPEWIDEEGKWGPQRCPEIPMPRLEDYGGGYQELDVIVASVPCSGSAAGGQKGAMRDVFVLQVNLVVANLVVANGWVSPDAHRTVYVVFMGSCGPMQEIFRCDDLLTRDVDYRVYKPEMTRLKQKVLMPMGSCQIAPPYPQRGREGWRHGRSERVAYATVLHSSEAYVCGAIALAQSIIQTNSTHYNDLILLHDSSITSRSVQGLRAAGWKTRKIQRIRSPFSKKGSYNEWNYSKLRVWQLRDYDKVVFIDADIVVLKNIDQLFLYPQLSASPNDKVMFNSGLMVIEPSSCMFENLLRKRFKLASYNGGDQGFLNEVFTWWHRLPRRLNYLKVFGRQGNQTRHEVADDLHALHFLGLKPWMCYKDYDCNWDMVDYHRFASDSAHKKWWQVYEAMPKKLQKYCHLTKQADARIRKWRGLARNAGLPDGHWNIKVTDPRQREFVK